jgi:predicted ABC-type ATPase
MKKVIKVIAGPNGSGKTTFAEAFVTRSKIPFLNPDIIASGLGTLNFERASFHAGRILLTEIKEKIKKGESFAFESTLSGRTYASILREAKTLGFEVEIYFIFLNKINLNYERIKNRVSLGGHNIPSKIVKRRQNRCFDNFWNIYRLAADEWAILDNSASKPKLILRKQEFDEKTDKEKKQISKRFLSGKL